MLEKGKFMEMLSSMVEIAKTQDDCLTMDEIKDYFKEIELSKEQMDAVYAYLAENKVTVKGFTYVPPAQEKTQKVDDKENSKDSVYLNMYLKDLAGIVPEAPGELSGLYARLRGKEAEVKSRLTELWLKKVVKLARGYQNQGVFLEDLIQEGNMGLLAGLQELMIMEEAIDMEEYLKEYVCQTMENLIDETMGKEDLENTILAKTNLLHEATKLLAEDLGRVATVAELSEYTKIPAEEIEDILTLSLDAVKTGEGEERHAHHHHEHHHEDEW